MAKTVVVYHSGYGHTQFIAQTVAKGANAQLVAIDADGNVSESDWAALDAADAIVMGSPTYMGGVSWQFKKFADASSKRWFTRAWQDKFFAGFSVSASLNGDKGMTLAYLQTLASQHGGLWISLGMAPANASASTRNTSTTWAALWGCWCRRLLTPAPTKFRKAMWIPLSSSASVWLPLRPKPAADASVLKPAARVPWPI